GGGRGGEGEGEGGEVGVAAEVGERHVHRAGVHRGRDLERRSEEAVRVEATGTEPAAVPVGDAHALAAARAPVEAVLARSGAERAVGGGAAGARPRERPEAAEAGQRPGGAGGP